MHLSFFFCSCRHGALDPHLHSMPRTDRHIWKKSWSRDSASVLRVLFAGGRRGICGLISRHCPSSSSERKRACMKILMISYGKCGMWFVSTAGAGQVQVDDGQVRSLVFDGSGMLR